MHKDYTFETVVVHSNIEKSTEPNLVGADVNAFSCWLPFLTFTMVYNVLINMYNNWVSCKLAAHWLPGNEAGGCNQTLLKNP